MTSQVGAYPQIPIVNIEPEDEDDAFITEMNETIMYVKMCRAGHNFDEEVKADAQEKIQQVKDRVASMKEQLQNKQRETAARGRELLENIARIDLLEPAEFQLENIEQALPALKEVTDKLATNALLGDRELQRNEQVTIQLSAELENLTRDLKKAEGKYYWFQGPLNQFASQGINTTYGNSPVGAQPRPGRGGGGHSSSGPLDIDIRRKQSHYESRV